MSLFGISSSFPELSPAKRHVTHALLTRSPLSTRASSSFSFDLHVLSMPPAFVLSQDQTLQFFPVCWWFHLKRDFLTKLNCRLSKYALLWFQMNETSTLQLTY